MDVKKHRVLLIEDDKIDQMAFERFVKDQDLPYDYTIADSIRVAKELLNNSQFDVVITDFSLGDGNAFDVIDLIKTIPVVFITGTSNQEIAVQAMKAGAYDLLIKDIDREYLKVMPLTLEKAIKQKNLEINIQKLSRAVEYSASIVVITDKTGCIDYVNPKFTRLTGYDADAVMGKNPNILRSGKTPPGLYKDLWEALLSGKEWQGEFFNKRKDGTCYWESATISAIRDSEGEVTHFIKVAEDITERKTAEEELKKYAEHLQVAKELEEENAAKLAQLVEDLEIAKNRAEAATRTKSVFLANMSHEIRTPMNGIIGMTELALDTQITPLQKEYMESVMISAESLLTLINDILDFSKIEAGKLDIESIDFDLRDSIESTLQTLALRASDKGLELISHIFPDVPDALVGDPMRIRQIILNLVNNAIKFTDAGEVILRIEKDSMNKSEVVLRCSVSDTGIGIPEEKQKLIFDSFAQADGSMTRQYGGTGLGLAITSKLIQMMNGRIWAESSLKEKSCQEGGPGSVFHFFIELGVQKEPSKKSAIAKIDLKGIPVLIVDDNATNRRVLQEMVTNWGMKPTAVESGALALELLEKTQAARPVYSLILLDANMPCMDGFELAEKIRASDRYDQATIMMLTSSNRQGDVERCKQIGISDYLVKPVKQSDLLGNIRHTLGRWEKGEGERVIDFKKQKMGKQHFSGSEDSISQSQIKILLAEDNPINQKLAEALIKKRGWHVVSVADGKEALGAYRQEIFDIILMDVQMPRMDGIKATAEIRKIEAEEGTHIPIVAMTAHAMRGDKEKCLNAGMDGYVSKPMKASELYKALEQFLNGKFKIHESRLNAVEASQ
jgi:PAS domain S-box-containing protein